MPRVAYQLEQTDENSSPLPSVSFPHSTEFGKQSNPSSPSPIRISPAVLLVIVIVSVVIFIFGLLHLLVRFFVKRPFFSSISQSNRYPETSGSHSLQRQLQQLFRLHDSGLDQSLIDALPVFHYKDIMGLKEPFDCAVCLCEFSDHDKLRLLPICSHAFHISCIDTWLLSNSTCPLCRGSLNSSSLPMKNPLFNLEESNEEFNGFSNDRESEFSVIMRESVGDKRVFNVRLGKFRSLNEVGVGGERSQGETSSRHLDARRCYSMGSFQYVVGDVNLHVALPFVNGGSDDVNLAKVRGESGNSALIGDMEGKKISGRTRGESFSVSKIWLWSKKDKFSNSSDSHLGASSLNIGMPINIRTQTFVKHNPPGWPSCNAICLHDLQTQTS